MAHFAKLGPGNVVEQVIVIDDKDTSDAFGVEKEHIGAAFCERLLGGRWVKTSYNNKIRKRYAGIGFIYDEQRDAFIPPKPYPLWILDEETLLWKPPVEMPAVGAWKWNEAEQKWEEDMAAKVGVFE